MPKVSVIIPTYNRSQSVREAIESVLAQTYRDHEVIVVDDGSADDTPAVLGSFGDRIKAIRQANAGVSAARNAGIRAARGDWLAFLDSDDLWVPGKLERQMADVAAYPKIVGQMVDALVVGYGEEEASMFDVRGARQDFELGPLRERPLLDVMNVQFFTSTWMLKREAVVASGYFRVGFTIYEDLELLTKVALRGPFAVANFGGVKMRRVPGQEAALSNQHREKLARSLGNVCEIYQGLLVQPGLSPAEGEDIRRRLSGARYELAGAVAANGEHRRARTLRWRSVQDRPGVKSLVRAISGEVGCDALLRKLSVRLKPPGREFRRSAMDTDRKAAARPAGR
jgi:hypothetical protein